MQNSPYCDNQDNLLDYIHLSALCLGLIDNAGRASAMPDIAAQIQLIEHRETATPPQTALTLPLLRNALALDNCAYFCVVFALSCELDGQLRTQVQSRCGGAAPTFDLVFSLYNLLYPTPLGALFSYPNPNIGLLRLAFKLDGGFLCEQPLLAAPLLLRRNILHFLVCGSLSPCGQYRIMEPDSSGTLALHEETLQAAGVYIADTLAGVSNLYFFLAGAPCSGKRTLIRRIAAARGVACLLLDCTLLTEQDGEQLSSVLAADILLGGAMLCLLNWRPDCIRQTEELLIRLPSAGVPLFILCEDELLPPPALNGRIPLVHTLSILCDEDYAAAWARLRRLYPVEPALETATPAYRLTIGQMERVWAGAAHSCRCAGQERIGWRDLAKAVRCLNSRTGTGVPFHSGATLDDMVLGKDTRARLRLICAYARQEQVICKQWGFSARMPYGRGVTALLCGASGTGKTMAASAIANDLGLELLRLDISQIFDKYIGETEKKLAAIFSAASKSNYILFFDEADALFSKRTEISSSHDRYANVETSFLLQSIEQYDGIVLLATNLFKNFDEAFLRRINVVARFPMPDEALRLELWRAVFPPQTPLAPNLDFTLLARELELSPAVIKSAALCAAVLAAESGLPVGMEQLISGLRNELEKCGQESRLAALAPMLMEGESNRSAPR